MAHHTTWKDVIPGLLALTVLVAVCVGVLAFGRVGALHGDSITLYAAMPEARGVLQGTEVWVYGQKVGLVRSVGFPPPGSDSTARVIVDMEVLSDYRTSIRFDALAQVRSGGTLIGAPVVNISGGSTQARAVVSGDTLRALAQNDFEQVASRFGVASREFPAIIANVKLLGGALTSAQGTLGALGIEKGGGELAATREHMAWLSARVGGSSGTMGRALNARRELAERTRHLRASVDSVRRLVSSNSGTVGRFRRDSTLAQNVRELRDQIAIVQAVASSPAGTLGRLSADSAIVLELSDMQRDMASLLADVRLHPLRYIRF